MCKRHTLYKCQQRVVAETLVFTGDSLSFVLTQKTASVSGGQRLGVPGIIVVALL